MSPVKFKKWPCGPVEFMGRGSQLMEQLRLLLSGCGVGGQGDLWSYNGGSGGD